MVNSKLLEAYRLQKSVCTDTRKVKAGDLFFALKGPNFNGNRFAAKALDGGAAYAIVDEAEFHNDKDDRYILVENGLFALQELALAIRRTWDVPVIGITGTNGKTTTKELFQAVLSTEKRVWTTKGNLNNHIGVPLTILAKPVDAELVVIEMGANKQGDIQELCEIAEPDFGLITNIGEAHLERFGDVNGVQQTKGELFEFIRNKQGCAWINEGDFRVVATSGEIACSASYGSADSDLKLISKELSLQKTDLVIAHPKWETSVSFSSPLMGAHNVSNILAAILCGIEMGISIPGIQQGIAAYAPTNNRTQLIEKSGYALLMDAYNANPSSMRAAIQSCCEQQSGKVALVLGDMFELGDNGSTLHADLGRFLNQFTDQITVLVAVGEAMKFTFEAANIAHKLHTESLEEAAQFLNGVVENVDLLMIKGSRGMALERIVPLLKD